MSLAKEIQETNRRLRELIERQRVEEAPQVQENIDWSRVISAAVSRRDEVIRGTYHEDNDDAQYMLEDVMTAVFGKDYFEWENGNTN